MRLVVLGGGRVLPTHGAQIRTRLGRRLRSGGGATLGRPSTPSRLRVREVLSGKRHNPSPLDTSSMHPTHPIDPLYNSNETRTSPYLSSVISNRGHLFQPNDFSSSSLLGRTRMFSLSTLSLSLCCRFPSFSFHSVVVLLLSVLFVLGTNKLEKDPIDGRSS